MPDLAFAESDLVTFHDAILNEDYSQPTVEPSVESHWLGLLGREACERNGETVNMDELLKAGKRLEFDPAGLKV